MIGNYPILGKIKINNSEIRTTLENEFVKASRLPGDVAMACFRPRHAIRISHAGKPIDLIICFECVKVLVIGKLPGLPEVSATREMLGSFEATDIAEEAFDFALRNSNIPLSRDLESVKR